MFKTMSQCWLSLDSRGAWKKNLVSNFNPKKFFLFFSVACDSFSCVCQIVDPPRRHWLPVWAGRAEPAAAMGGDRRLDAASSLSATREKERERLCWSVRVQDKEKVCECAREPEWSVQLENVFALELAWDNKRESERERWVKISGNNIKKSEQKKDVERVATNSEKSRKETSNAAAKSEAKNLSGPHYKFLSITFLLNSSYLRVTNGCLFCLSGYSTATRVRPTLVASWIFTANLQQLSNHNVNHQCQVLVERFFFWW